MDDRRHVYHDPTHPPHEIVSGGVPGISQGGAPVVSPRARTTLWVVLWVALAGIGFLAMVFFGAAVFAGITDGIDDPMMSAPVTEAEESGVKGLAAVMADRGMRGDAAAIAALGDGSKYLDAKELASDITTAFAGPSRDWQLDYENTQMLIDQSTKERIVVFRLVLTDSQGEWLPTKPFYAVEKDGVWKLTGIRGRNVKEKIY